MRQIDVFTFLLITTISCTNNRHDFDGSGVFEAREVVVSSQEGGQLTEFLIEEGISVEADQLVGKLDCEDLILQKAQLTATKEALPDKRVEATPEILVIQKQITMQESQIRGFMAQYVVLEKDRDRLRALVAAESAPQKQLDDVQGELDVLSQKLAAAQAQEKVLQQQIASAERAAQVRNRGILSEEEPLQAHIARIENQIDRCNIINPIAGTVLAKYVETFEIIGAGKPLYKVADLGKMTFRAYLSGDQLMDIRLGQTVHVLVDDGTDAYKTYEGRISWIADKAEFTPKTIQTKSERANLVYAIKVDVTNDGYLRIGMYGELDF